MALCRWSYLTPQIWCYACATPWPTPQAHEVARLRAERRNYKPDPRFDNVVRLIRSGAFG